MFFDVKLLSIRQNGRFAKCWLAATNPKAFRAYVKRNDCEKIRVPSVCEEILQEFSKNVMNVKRRIPLYLAAQLVFGTVCIYQQQVHFLYEKTNNLLCSHVVILKEFRLKRSSEQEPAIKKKRRKLTKHENVGDVEKDFQESVLDEDLRKQIDLIPLDPEISNPHEFIIREVNWEVVCEEEQELFGEMTVKEKQDFLDLIAGKTTMAQLCQEEKEVEGETGQIPDIYVGKIREVKSLHEIAERRKNKVDRQKKAKISAQKDAMLDEDSIPVLREEPTRGNGDNSAPLIMNEPTHEKETTPTRKKHIVNIGDTLFSKNNETLIPNDILALSDRRQLTEMEVTIPENEPDVTLNYPRIEELQQNPNTLVLNCNENVEQNISEAHNNEPEKLLDCNLEDLSKALVAELYRPKKKKKKSSLKIDTCIKISSDDFLNQYDFEDTLRCYDPRDDIVPCYKLAYKTSDKLLACPSLMKNSGLLMESFKQNLITKGAEIDTNVLEDILDMPVTEFDEIFPTILTKKLTKISQIKSPEKSNQRVEPVHSSAVTLNAEMDQNLPQIEPELPPFQVVGPIDVPAISDFSRCQENTLPLNLQIDLFTNFRGEQPQESGVAQTALEASFSQRRERIRADWGKEAILRKLLRLWKNKVEPIDMYLICKGATCRDAACAFYSIIELGAHKYLKLIKNNENNEIYHIEMGERLIGKLNENFN